MFIIISIILSIVAWGKLLALGKRLLIEYSFKKWAVFFLVVKILGSVTATYLYLYHFDGDLTTYLHDVEVLNNMVVSDFSMVDDVLIYHQPVEKFPLFLLHSPRAFVMVKILFLLKFLSFNNVWLLAVLMPLLVWVCTMSCINTVQKRFDKLPSFSWLGLFMIPSVSFWGAGVFKETITICILLLMFKLVYSPIRKILVGVLFLGLAYLLLLLKYYVFACWVPVFLLCWLLSILKLQGLKKIAFYFLGFTLIAFIASFLHPNLNVNTLFQSIQMNYEASQELKYNSDISYSFKEGVMATIVGNFWTVLKNGWVSPLFHSSISFKQAIVAVENIGILLLFVTGVIGSIRSKQYVYWEEAIFILLIIFLQVFMLALSVPNAGTLVRYKTAIYPFLGVILYSMNLYWWHLLKRKRHT